jgi:hypothetical protein
MWVTGVQGWIQDFFFVFVILSVIAHKPVCGMPACILPLGSSAAAYIQVTCACFALWCDVSSSLLFLHVVMGFLDKGMLVSSSQDGADRWVRRVCFFITSFSLIDFCSMPSDTKCRLLDLLEEL